MGDRDVLGGRTIYWCEGGNGYPQYCPRGTDSDDNVYCCAYGYEVTIPTCCKYPFHTGLIYALYGGALIAILLLMFFTCWFCPACPLVRRVEEVSRRRRAI